MMRDKIKDVNKMLRRGIAFEQVDKFSSVPVTKDNAWYRAAKSLGASAEQLQEYLDTANQFRTARRIAWDKKIADELLVPEDVKRAFYIGRATDAALVVEAALKLKEISYIQTEGFAAGELKHGTISLIEDGTPVFAIVTQKNTAGLTRSNLTETAARGAKTVVISTDNLAKEGNQIVIPNETEELAPLMAVNPNQLLAYDASEGKGKDFDRHGNLEKSQIVQ